MSLPTRMGQNRNATLARELSMTTAVVGANHEQVRLHHAHPDDSRSDESMMQVLRSKSRFEVLQGLFLARSVANCQ